MIYTFIPAPKNAQEAAFQARIMQRATTLLEDGYHIRFAYHAFPDRTECQYQAAVTSPEGTIYLVNFGHGTEDCECECCKKNGYCKHLIAVLAEDERLKDEALCEAYEREQAGY